MNFVTEFIEKYIYYINVLFNQRFNPPPLELLEDTDVSDFIYE